VPNSTPSLFLPSLLIVVLRNPCICLKKIYPSAIFYGDIVVRNGVVRYDTSTPSSVVTTAASTETVKYSTISQQAKDTYQNQTGTCGMGFNSGENYVLLVQCNDCTEERFLRDRGKCCSDPQVCIPPKNETCYRFGGISQETLCSQAGCESLAFPVPVFGSTNKVTRCISKIAENTWEARLVADPKSADTIRLRKKYRELHEKYNPLRAREEMDRPSYHVLPDNEIHLLGTKSNLFDTNTGQAYQYIPDESNPGKMPFSYGDSPPKPVSFQIYNDRTALSDPSGTQLARVEVTTDWDLEKHYDLREKNGLFEFVYNIESTVPFLVLKKGVLRGTALVRIGTKNVTLVPSTTRNVAYTGKAEEEPRLCEGIAETHFECFSQGTDKYSTCAAALHSASATECCGNLWNKGIIIGC